MEKVEENGDRKIDSKVCRVDRVVLADDIIVKPFKLIRHHDLQILDF